MKIFLYFIYGKIIDYTKKLKNPTHNLKTCLNLFSIITKPKIYKFFCHFIYFNRMSPEEIRIQQLQSISNRLKSIETSEIQFQKLIIRYNAIITEQEWKDNQIELGSPVNFENVDFSIINSRTLKQKQGLAEIFAKIDKSKANDISYFVAEDGPNGEKKIFEVKKI